MKGLSSIWIIVPLCHRCVRRMVAVAGENRDGILTQFSAPEVWPKQLKKLWHVELGNASPILRKDGFTPTHGRMKAKSLLHLTSKRVRYPDRCLTCGLAWCRIAWSKPLRQCFNGLSLRRHASPAFKAVLWRKDFKKHLGFGSTSPIVVSGYTSSMWVNQRTVH